MQGVDLRLDRLFLNGNLLDFLNLCLQLSPNRKRRICGKIRSCVCAVLDLSAYCPCGRHNQLSVGAVSFHTQVEMHPGDHDLLRSNSLAANIEDGPIFSVKGSPLAAAAYQILGQPIPGLVIFNCDRNPHHPGCQRP